MRDAKICFLNADHSIVLSKRKTLISWGWLDKTRQEFRRLESVFISSKWEPCFILNCLLSMDICVVARLKDVSKCRHDFKLPLEALFSCPGLADVYWICTNYDL